MASVIARIKLARGESGYYDEISGVCLNWKHPVAEVLLGTDCSGLRASLRAHRIELMAGSLGQSKTFKQVLMEAKSKRTGEDLNTLMGDTPLAAEPTEVINEEASTVSTKAKATVDFVTPDKNEVKSAAKEDVKNEEKVEDTKAEAATVAVAAEDISDEEADGAEETVGDMTVKPGSIRKLKIGATREITSSTDIVSAESSDESIVTVTFEGKKAVVTGVSVGNAVVTLKDGANGEGIVETTVVKA